MLILNFADNLLRWVLGIIEDDPIPVEIKFLYFLIVPDRKGFHIEFGGKEIKEEVIYHLEYQPLEAEFFLMELNQPLNEIIALLEEAVDLIYLHDEFLALVSDKQVFISVYGSGFHVVV